MMTISRFSPVYVADPGGLWDKHKKYSFAIVINFVGMVNGFPEPMFDVLVADGDEVRRVFYHDLRKYPQRRKKA